VALLVEDKEGSPNRRLEDVETGRWEEGCTFPPPSLPPWGGKGGRE